MDELPVELIKIEICSHLVFIDQQSLRKVSKIFMGLIPYKFLEWNNTPIDLIHLIKYRRLITSETMLNLVKFNQLELLMWAIDNEFPWHSESSSAAARN